MAQSSKKNLIKDITFSCDGLELKATLHLPPVARPPVVIGSHGLFSDRNSPKQVALAHECNRLNLAYLRLDHRGCGESQGRFEDVTSLETRCRDLSQAIEFIKTNRDIGDRIGLFGSSMGGAVCLAVAAAVAIGPIVTVAAPLKSSPIQEAIEKPDAPNFRGPQFDAAKNAFDISQKLSTISNILLFHGDHDTVVPLGHATEIFRYVNEPKKLIIQKNGDHRMSDPAHQKEFLREASLWFQSGLLV